MLAPEAIAAKERAASIDTRPALRFLTCGFVDDGKSTLIGRLLYEQNLIFDDHLAAITRDSKKHGTTGDAVDFALLLDGLEPRSGSFYCLDWRLVLWEPRSPSEHLT